MKTMILAYSHNHTTVCSLINTQSCMVGLIRLQIVPLSGYFKSGFTFALSALNPPQCPSTPYAQEWWLNWVWCSAVWKSSFTHSKSQMQFGLSPVAFPLSIHAFDYYGPEIIVISQLFTRTTLLLTDAEEWQRFHIKRSLRSLSLSLLEWSWLR